MIRFFCVALLSLCLSQCALENTSSLSSSQKPITLALFGGFGSCKINRTTETMDMMNQFRGLYDSLRAQTDRPIYVLRSCFYLPSRSKVWFSFGGARQANMYQVSMQEFLSKKLPSYLSGDVYLIGHSYGGWMAMKAASQYLPKVSSKTLFSIDPISWKNCTQFSVFRNYFATGYSKNPVADCTNPPRDLKFLYPRISRVTKHWHNFYQVTYPLLHSGFISAADQNTMPSMELEVRLDGHHGQINYEPKVWSPIKKSILGSIL